MKKSAVAASAAILALFLLLAGTLPGNQDLLAAFESGNAAAALRLLTDNPSLLKADLGRGVTALHYGVLKGYEPVVDFALKNGIDMNIKDRLGRTPIWFSIIGNQPAMLRKFIVLGADLTAKNAQGNNMLFRAASGGNAEIFGILLDHGFKADEKNGEGATPFLYAFRTNSLDIVRLLVARGFDLKTAADPNIPLLHEAVITGRAEAIHYLLDLGYDVDVKNAGGATPLLVALDSGNMEGVRALVMRGADVNAADAGGVTPFLNVVKRGHKAFVDLFLKKGAAPDAADARTGRTALHESALRGHAGIVETLLAHGAQKNAKDKNGFTALSYALKYGNMAAADVLRKNGAAEVPGESNLDDAVQLNKALKPGEASIWYLKHSGWAIKTKSAFLIFDYWDSDAAPDRKLLANGHIDPEELKNYPVYVFSSHEHADHFDPQILEWRKTIPNITYIFGFEPQAKDGIVSLAPRIQRTLGPLAVTTIAANDLGVGFAVQVDGLTIFHAGDHANGSLETAGNNFFPEIDFLAQKGIRPDIAFFLNMYGCGSTNPEAFQKGIFYAVDKLKIKAVLPMHGADREWVYGNLAEGAAQNKINVQVGAATASGDRFFFTKGALAK